MIQKLIGDLKIFHLFDNWANNQQKKIAGMLSKISNWETSKTKHHKVHFMKIQNTIKKLKIVKNKNKNPPRWKIKHQWWSSFVSLNATTMSSSYNIISGKKLIDVCFHSNMKSPFYPSLLVLTLEEVKCQQRNQQFYMEIMDIRLVQIKRIPCIATMSAPPGSSAKDPAPITSSDS